MLAAYACRTGVALCAGKSAISKATVLFSKQNVYTGFAFRQASNQTRSSFTRRAAKSRSLKEIVMSPAGEGGMSCFIIENNNIVIPFCSSNGYFVFMDITAFSVGKGVVLGASGLGLGALCFYGLGLSSVPGAIDRSV